MRKMHARIAGGLYFLSVATAIADEALVHGKLLYLVSIIPIASFLVATVLLYNVAPYDTALGFIGEGALMLWLLVMGVKVRQRTTFG